MIYRQLGRTGITVSTISLGCEGFMGKSGEEVRADFDFAEANGINFFDLYASNPDLRSAIGVALKGRREKYVIQWCHSVMWGCIFTLVIKGLKKYTSQASGVFMMGVFGGAVFPVLQGILADAWGSWQWTWMIVVVCELVMLYYALFGSRIKDGECM